MLTILVAHRAEGEPFIIHYQMVADPDGKAGRRFIGERAELVIIGQGPDNARKSVARELVRQSARSTECWLNVGVAGSAEFDPGEVVQVSAVANGSSPDSPTIPLPTAGGIAVTECVSFDKPQSVYPDKGVVDMEAYAIVSTLAGRPGTETLQVLKLVIDGPRSPAAGLDRRSYRNCLESARSTLITISDKLA